MKAELIRNFNKIAKFSKNDWNHNNNYYPLIIDNLPVNRDSALDVGCGAGALARCMAPHFNNLTGIDFSDGMILNAIKDSQDFPNVDFIVKDFMEVEDGSYQVDCIVSAACFHHLPLEKSLAKMKSFLKKSGRIIILDLYKESSIGDYMTGFCASLLNPFYMMKNKNIKMDKEYYRAWKEHDRFEQYKTLKEISAICKKLFINVSLKRLLFWRYILILDDSPYLSSY